MALSRAEQRPLRVLLVEDDPAHAHLMQDVLESLDPRIGVVLAQDGARALAQLQAAEPLPDLILLDLVLPDRNGLEVLTALRERGDARGVPVLVISGQADPSLRREAYQLHANACLEKPATLAELREQLTRTAQFWLGLSLPGAARPQRLPYC